MAPLCWIELDPSSGEYSEKMRVRKDDNRLTLHTDKSLDHAICPSSYSERIFTFGTAIDEGIPARDIHPNVGGSLTFVAPVVPFHEVIVGNRVGTETSEFTGHSGTLQGAYEHLSGLKTCEAHSQLARRATSVLIEWNVRPSGVTPCF